MESADCTLSHTVTVPQTYVHWQSALLTQIKQVPFSLVAAHTTISAAPCKQPAPAQIPGCCQGTEQNRALRRFLIPDCTILSQQEHGHGDGGCPASRATCALAIRLPCSYPSDIVDSHLLMNTSVCLADEMPFCMLVIIPCTYNPKGTHDCHDRAVGCVAGNSFMLTPSFATHSQLRDRARCST